MGERSSEHELHIHCLFPSAEIRMSCPSHWAETLHYDASWRSLCKILPFLVCESCEWVSPMQKKRRRKLLRTHSLHVYFTGMEPGRYLLLYLISLCSFSVLPYNAGFMCLLFTSSYLLTPWLHPPSYAAQVCFDSSVWDIWTRVSDSVTSPWPGLSHMGYFLTNVIHLRLK